MAARNRSISIQVISRLVVVATIILMTFAMTTILVYRNREQAKLHGKLSVTAEQLQTALAAALWNFDITQLDKVLDGGMKDKTLTGIVVKTGRKVYARSRDGRWESIAREPVGDQTGIITHEQPVIYDGQKLGTITLFSTTKFLKNELITSIYYFGGSILLLDLFLVSSLYRIFSRIVLVPLKKLETYAVSVSSGDQRETSLGSNAFSGEMEVLRSSLKKMVVLLEARYSELQQEAKRFMISEERFRTLVNTIPDLIWLKNAEGVYLSCNKMFERFFGAREADIVGKTDYDFVDKELADFFRENDLKAMAVDKPSTNEEWLTFADDGHQSLFDTTKTPMYDAEGKLIGVLGIGHDITTRKQAEETKTILEGQLQQAQKIESVGRLAGGVAHDFNNMLGVIFGHAELALLKIAPSHPLHANLLEIRKAAERSADLTRQLLAFARKQTIAPKVLDLNAIVAGMLRMLQRLIGEDIHLNWHPAANLWPLMMDPSQIDQILVNLCVNSRDAISGVGNLTIATENRTFDNSYCDIHMGVLPGDYVLLAVSDDGLGMDKQTLTHIFEPFFTTKGVGEGTGLGLAMVYGAVRQNNGFINVYSEPGMGTTITIYLPRYEGHAGRAPKEGTTETLPCGQETILLVEDEPAILKLTTMMLESLGYTVIMANTTAEATRLARENADKIHLLITDVIMPEMNGRDLAHKLLSDNAHLKTLFMSGYTSNIIAHHGVLDEGMHFIQKPFSMKDLASKVRETLT